MLKRLLAVVASATVALSATATAASATETMGQKAIAYYAELTVESYRAVLVRGFRKAGATLSAYKVTGCYPQSAADLGAYNCMLYAAADDGVVTENCTIYLRVYVLGSYLGVSVRRPTTCRAR